MSLLNCRSDFPSLSVPMNGRPLAYLDSASSAQKPQVVIDSLSNVYSKEYSNIHRGLYSISQNITEKFETSRYKLSKFLNAPRVDEIVFTRNATEAINLIASSYGGGFLRAGDEVIISAMEHHANIVPWQLLCETIGIDLKIIPLMRDYSLDLEAYRSLLTERTRLVSVTHISNALGIRNNVKLINEIAKNYNPDIVMVVDGSQGAVHGVVDVQDLGCDFYVVTGHKLYAPSGIGGFWGRFEILEKMPPYQGGGDMIEEVTFEAVSFKPPPAKFEAGTPAIADVIAWGAALDYLSAIGMDKIEAHEQHLLDFAMKQMAQIDGLNYYGVTSHKAGIVSFTADWAHISDIAMVLDKCGVAMRAGHHCCMPLMGLLGVTGTLRASFGLYTNEDDILALVAGLKKAKELLS
jgi:cysteine desulfurase/selenocysteine lyase